MNAFRIGKRLRPPRRFATARRCSAEGCTTVLSAYNDDNLCWQHADRRFFVHRRGRRKRG